MDSLVRLYEDDLVATRSVTALPLPYAPAHVSRLSSNLAKQKMRMKLAQVQDDRFHLDDFQSLSLLFTGFCFLASSLAFHGIFSRAISRMVIRMGKCQDKSVGRSKYLCFWSSQDPSGFFLKTNRISTMHILRMIVAKAEETHGLRVNFVLCFSTLIIYNKLKIFCFHWKQNHQMLNTHSQSRHAIAKNLSTNVQISDESERSW